MTNSIFVTLAVQCHMLQSFKCKSVTDMTHCYVTCVTQFVIYVTFVTECLLSLELAIHYWKLRETTRILCEHNSLEN